ncbi:SDR family oxidoreductase [Pseudomonas protegens]|jgi:NADP-dependent 3-hydroxy acid dehydrogenase YdfG|uniref:Short chain dehydrogenase/reductase family protein n=2 Tax=Pseudomonas protegens TaxID=380021 RepID=Q4K7Y8_PSEF5|nr:MULTISPECIES: SDR family oxidoreductase [Pseudomonas]GED74906.1 oxidoreductase [Pseudomonas fluorescens]AAY93807.1 short chain dehydrogenase/reductase family protein [Pseudomonas protegens Pf-5]AQT11502.1 short chain dehydrogenase/reductase [Pseudomonas protegens]ASE22038.1 SDR family NAD(P)-dependent oxidoreductase [Pseudomonas protegens]MCU1764924.1 SDR family oxidoreductase [Pseudomonas protegens]
MSKPLVIITGASSGIGEATARLLSAAGHPLLLLARRVERLHALELPDSLSRAVDITDRAALLAAVAEAEARFGPADALINNAGVMLLGEISRQDPQQWERMLDVNVKGLLNGVHAVVSGMIERRQGTLINVSSVAGRKTFANHVAYVGTKFAVHGLSENLREELAPHNVRVITIAPGAVETELLSHTTDEAIKAGYQAWKQDMGGTVLSADDVAGAIAFAYQQPQQVCIREIVLAATRQQA